MSKLTIAAEPLNTEALYNGQQNVQEQESKADSGKLVQIEKVEGTPFTVVTIEGSAEVNDTFIAVGNERLTDLGDYEEMKRKIEERDWELIVQLQVFIANKVNEETKLENK